MRYSACRSHLKASLRVTRERERERAQLSFLRSLLWRSFRLFILILVLFVLFRTLHVNLTLRGRWLTEFQCFCVCCIYCRIVCYHVPCTCTLVPCTITWWLLFSSSSSSLSLSLAGNRFWLFREANLEPGYPQELVDYGRDIPYDRMDAAIWWEPSGYTYFFQGDW